MQKTYFYSDSEEFLQGMEEGMNIVGDTSLTVGEVEESDKYNYKYMLVVDDEDVEGNIYAYRYFNGSSHDYVEVFE